MKAKQLIPYFTVAFLAGFVANLVVVYLWNFIFHAKGVIDWGEALFFGILIGSIMTIVEFQKNRKSAKTTSK